MEKKKIITWVLVGGFIISILAMGVGTMSGQHSLPTRHVGGVEEEQTPIQKVLSIIGFGSGYGVVQKIGLASTCYYANGVEHVIPSSSFSNSDEIEMYDYVSNSGGIGFRCIDGTTHFRDVNTGRTWSWGWGHPCTFSSSWTHAFLAWGPQCGSGFPASDVCSDCVVEVYSSWDSPVNMNTTKKVISIGNYQPVCTPLETECRSDNLWQCSSDGSAWVFIQTCPYGCSERACNPTPVISISNPFWVRVIKPYNATPYGILRINGEGEGLVESVEYNMKYYHNIPFIGQYFQGSVLSTYNPEGYVERYIYSTSDDIGSTAYITLNIGSTVVDYKETIIPPFPTPTVTPTPTPTPTASPTPTPTPDPSTCIANYEKRCFGNYLKTCNSAGNGWDESKTVTCTWGCDAEKKECPAFEAVFAIVGILAVAYMVRRRKRNKAKAQRN